MQEFLSGLGVIHRDLACRNILIGEQKNLKISDFGMSRHLPRDEVYVPTSSGLLPLRWMAIESIRAREFTTASDVWAFGVVLWELCTLCRYTSYILYYYRTNPGRNIEWTSMEKETEIRPWIKELTGVSLVGSAWRAKLDWSLEDPGSNPGWISVSFSSMYSCMFFDHIALLLHCR